MKNPHFFYTHLILASIRPLVNHWSPVTNASHCMTTSRPAAATQMRVRVSQAMHRDIFTLMPLLLKPSLFPAFGTGPAYAGLHTLNFKTSMNYMTIHDQHPKSYSATGRPASLAMCWSERVDIFIDNSAAKLHVSTWQDHKRQWIKYRYMTLLVSMTTVSTIQYLKL